MSVGLTDLAMIHGDFPGTICFSPDALVLLADGSRVPVRSLELGDLLASVDGPVAIAALYRDMRSKRWVSFNGDVPFVTSTHPVSTARGFVPAGEVVPGDVLDLEDGRTLQVLTISFTVQADLNINVETEDHRPFYVNEILFASYPSYPASG